MIVDVELLFSVVFFFTGKINIEKVYGERSFVEVSFCIVFVFCLFEGKDCDNTNSPQSHPMLQKDAMLVSQSGEGLFVPWKRTLIIKECCMEFAKSCLSYVSRLME